MSHQQMRPRGGAQTEAYDGRPRVEGESRPPRTQKNDVQADVVFLWYTSSMRIKPYVILGVATVCAGAALATVVMNNDPYVASTAMIWLFWGALTLVIWSGVATLFSLTGQRLATALSGGVFWATGLVSLAFLWHSGLADKRLSAAVIGATIVLSIILWIRSKKSAKPLSLN